MHEVGLCSLRGVYSIVPDAADVPGSREPASACAFAGPGHSVTGCSAYYYTSGCLLYFDCTFCDPCLCCEAGRCVARAFSPESCVKGLLVDGRELLHQDEVLLTSSLHWPADVLPSEAYNGTHWELLREALHTTQHISKLEIFDFDSLFERTAGVLLQRDDTEHTPHSYCDDLFDYWPDVQHPVGYQPSTACITDETHTRGFALVNSLWR